MLPDDHDQAGLRGREGGGVFSSEDESIDVWVEGRRAKSGGSPYMLSSDPIKVGPGDTRFCRLIQRLSQQEWVVRLR